jgi:hypothetical protein
VVPGSSHDNDPEGFVKRFVKRFEALKEALKGQGIEGTGSCEKLIISTI